MRPVRIRSIALALPTARVSRCVPPMPGMTPSLISGWPNFALSAAMMMSHMHRELAAAAEREARDRRDHRLAHARDAIPVAGEVAHEGVHVGLACHLLDVGAGRERLLGAGDDHAADVVVGLERVDRGGQLLVDQRGVERVERLRPVEADDADLALGFDDEGFVAHGVPPCYGNRRRIIGERPEPINSIRPNSPPDAILSFVMPGLVAGHPRLAS